MRTFMASLALWFTAAPALAADPAVGSPAPDFAFVGSDGKTYAHSQFVGKRGVVLA